MSNDVLQELLIEFVEVWLHNVIYICNIYPSQIFRSRYKYSVSVKQSTYPPLNNYIRKLVLSLAPHLMQQSVHSITVSVYNGLQTEESFSLVLSYPTLSQSQLTPEQCITHCKDAFRGHVISVLSNQGGGAATREMVEEGRGFTVSVKTSELAGSQLSDWCSETIAEEMGVVTPLLFSDVGPIRVQSLHREGPKE